MKLNPSQQAIVLDLLPKVKEWIPAKYYGRLREEKESDAFLALTQAVAEWQGDYDETFLTHLKDEVFKQWRESYNVFRRNKRRHSDVDPEAVIPCRELSPEFVAAFNETKDKLSEQDRKVIDFLLDGNSAANIQSLTGRSQATVYRRITKAKESWEKLFGE